MAHPVILVTGTSEQSARPYADSLKRRGAQVRLALSNHTSSNGYFIGEATALMLTGGPDVDPALYGEPVDPAAGVETNRRRDDMELALVRQALDQDIPVLGICRGMQLLNVHFGGKLIQDLPNHRAQGRDGQEQSAFHQVYLSPGCKLAATLGTGGIFRLNSRHHQGLKEPQKSPALLAAAYSLHDGIIEALESPAHGWVIGVQCHPENEEEMPKVFGRLFEAFIERADMNSRRLY